jgi:mRNA-degrading endonuclease toxin of MazEF toxin-antitoxin module
MKDIVNRINGLCQHKNMTIHAVSKVLKMSPKNGLAKDSMALAESIRYIPKEKVQDNKKIGTLEQEYFSDIGEALMSQYPMTMYAAQNR